MRRPLDGGLASAASMPGRRSRLRPVKLDRRTTESLGELEIREDRASTLAPRSRSRSAGADAISRRDSRPKAITDAVRSRCEQRLGDILRELRGACVGLIAPARRRRTEGVRAGLRAGARLAPSRGCPSPRTSRTAAGSHKESSSASPIGSASATTSTTRRSASSSPASRLRTRSATAGASVIGPSHIQTPPRSTSVPRASPTRTSSRRKSRFPPVLSARR